jgi:hypothetical protein
MGQLVVERHVEADIRQGELQGEEQVEGLDVARADHIPPLTPRVQVRRDHRAMHNGDRDDHRRQADTEEDALEVPEPRAMRR